MKKNLNEYNFPQDLKAMSTKELELLSYSIRDFLISKVSATGGHIASNLGVVELSLALHKVFDSPKDKIIWDVGHQAYVHKLLTGRAQDFDTLRKFEGMSGFPKGKESPHDAYDTGHSSVSISAAAGMAAARDINGDDYEVVAVIGDGSLTGGMAYEGLNNIGDSKSKVIVILNDNGMSISPNIGGISDYLGRIRTSQGYLGAKRFIKTKVKSIPSIGKLLAQGLADFKNDVKYSVIEREGILFEELGFTYFGPVDGHNIEELTEVMIRAKSLDEPVLIHVITKKGKGYLNAEKNPDKFHGVGPFDPETGKPLKPQTEPTYSFLLGQFLTELAEKDDRIVAITAAMGEGTGLRPFINSFPNRFFDVGIAEEHAISFAAGLAKSGMKPLVAIYSSFIQRGYDQLMEDVCMQDLPIVFALDRAGFVGADGETHHGIYDLSFMSTIPNMTVLTPKDGNQFKAMLEYAFKLGHPCAIRYPKDACNYNNNIMSTYMGKNIRYKKGMTVDIWACGKMFPVGLQVLELLKLKGIWAGLVDVTTVKPMDLSVYDEGYDLIVSLEDNSVCGGFGSALSSALCGKTVEFIKFGWPDAFVQQGSFDEVGEKYGLTPAQITERICEAIEGKA